jgi:putative addiction module component (TIGR02574 family)
MTVSHKDVDFSQLSPDERILLAQDLWDSVLTANRAPATTPAQRTEIARRIALADSGQMPGSPWSEVKAALQPKK